MDWSALSLEQFPPVLAHHLPLEFDVLELATAALGTALETLLLVEAGQAGVNTGWIKPL